MTALRSAWCVLFAITVACGEDGPSESDGSGMGGDGDTDFDAGGDGATPASCDRSTITAIAGFSGDRAWTKSDFEACEDACPEVEDACLMSSCAGYREFESCAKSELSACVTQQNGPCRTLWEDLICCARVECEGLASDALGACLDARCAAPSTTFSACRDQALGTGDEDISACLRTAQQSCFMGLNAANAGV